MNIALISDIHANLPALDAVLADIETRKPDAVYCLGDLVGYATWPNEVVETIRGRGIPTIAGNYDVGVGAGTDDCGCAYKTELDRERGAQSIAWTNDEISETNRTYLHDLPRHIRIEFGSENQRPAATLLLVHGSPRRVNEYLFEDRADSSLRRIMLDANCEIMAFGHTHIPFHRTITVDGTEDGSRVLHAINIGSVGKPKDGDPRACYAMLTMSRESRDERIGLRHVEFIRVPYDVAKAAAAIEESPLPDAFAAMLRNGG